MELSSSVLLKEDFPEGRGVAVTKDVKKGDVLLEVPLDRR